MGLCPRKRINWTCVASASRNMPEIPDAELAQYTGDYSSTLNLNYGTLSDIALPVEADVATGLMLINRKAFSKIDSWGSIKKLGVPCSPSLSLFGASRLLKDCSGIIGSETIAPTPNRAFPPPAFLCSPRRSAGHGGHATKTWARRLFE